MDYTAIISLLGGLSLFLFGMKVMGEGLERAAGSRLKQMLEAVTSNRLLGMLMGVGITAVIQSSSATTVMVVGFVNARLMSLSQAIGVIMGANIGTTVTSLLLSVKIDIGAICAILGMALSFMSKRRALVQTGNILMGLGVLFTGMNLMTSAMKPLQELQAVRDLMAGINNPLLGVLIGASVTAVIQSSSASVGILQVMVSGGLMSLHTALFVLYGQNIGTCVTALLASTGAGKAAKRAAVVHLLFNMIGAGLFIALTLCLPLDVWLASLSPDNLKLQIALSHIAFNVTTTLVLLPLAGVLEKIARLVVRGEDPRAEAMRLQYFDERLLATPPIAVAQLFRESCRMGQVALDTVRTACDAFLTGDLTRAQLVRDGEEITDYLNEEITRYLIEVKALDLNERDNQLTGALFHAVNDFERIGDHAMNVLENAARRVERRVKLSGKAQAEMEDMVARVEHMLEEALRMFGEQSTRESDLALLQSEEEAVDELTDQLREQHIDRLKEKKCTPKSGILFVDMLTNLERVADHATNVAEAFTAQ